MDSDKIMIVDYSDKAIAIAVEYDTGLQDEFKAIGGRFNSRLAFGPGWIFSKKKHRKQLDGLFSEYGITDMFTSVALSDIISEPTGASKASKTTRPGAALPDYILTDEQRKEWAETEHEYSKDYYYKNYNIVVRLSGGEIVPIEKKSLKTEFWFGESDWQGPTLEEAQAAAHNASTNEDYFLTENLQDYKDMIARLDGTCKSSYKYLWLVNYNRDNNNHWSLDKSSVCPEAVNAIEALDWNESKMHEEGRYRKLSDDDKQRLLAGYNLALQAMGKRCRAYLKRYGLSKIHASTYWMDR